MPKNNPKDLGKMIFDEVIKVAPEITKETLKIAAEGTKTGFSYQNDLTDKCGAIDCLLFYATDGEFELGGGVIEPDILSYSYGLTQNAFGTEFIKQLGMNPSTLNSPKSIESLWRTAFKYIGYTFPPATYKILGKNTTRKADGSLVVKNVASLEHVLGGPDELEDFLEKISETIGLEGDVDDNILTFN